MIKLVLALSCLCLSSVISMTHTGGFATLTAGSLTTAHLEAGQ